ncbi:MAG: peptidylprolyl isomerase [Candidatus Bipolaricaulota bacterium]|nr:peptidylprolyl isomerase [Candidatus Bipolaricaulota bacterium]MDW8030638.1 peptidylprolyl isomerase [Candidatus Bipolaricaulota bacterium]
MASWMTWVVVGLVAVGLFFVWQGLESGGPALILEGQQISQREFTKLYENLVAQYQRFYAQYGQDFSKLLQGPGGIEHKLQLHSRVIDELLRRRLITQEIERRRLVIPSADIDDQTEIAFERILKQNNLTEEQAAQILKQQGRTLESFKRELRQAVELNIKIERLRDAVVGPIEPTDQELSSYLEKHRDKYDTPEQVRARHILIRVPENASEVEIAQAKKQIEDIKKEIENGADFAELAKEHSQDPGSAQNGGDLGWFTRGQMVPEFEDAAFALEPGQISDPVRTQFGFHLIKVEEKKPAQRPELAQIRDRVLRDYIEVERERRFNEFYRDLKARAKIVIADPILRVFYLYEYAGHLEEARHEYAKLKDPNQKLHIARVLRKRLDALGENADPTLVHALKEEIVRLWLAQMAAWPNRSDRSYALSQITALKPNELPGQAFFQITFTPSPSRAQGEVVLNDTIRMLQKRLKEFGVQESIVLAAGDAQIAIWARTERPKALERLVSVQGKLELKRVLREGAVGEMVQATGLGEQVLKDRAEAAKPGSGRSYLVTEAPVLDRLDIKEISLQTSPAGRPNIIRVRLSERTGQQLAKALGQTDQVLAIVIDNIVYGTVMMGAPMRELLAQPGSVFDIQFEDAPEASLEEAHALVVALRLGPLPAAVRVARP